MAQAAVVHKAHSAVITVLPSKGASASQVLALQNVVACSVYSSTDCAGSSHAQNTQHSHHNPALRTCCLCAPHNTLNWVLAWSFSCIT